MLGDAIEYTSGNHSVNGNTNELVLESKSNKEIKCIWSKRILYYSPFRIIFKWKFDWSKLKKQGFDKITGHITIESADNSFTAKKMNVELTENNQEFTNELDSISLYDTVYYQYSLTPHYAPVLEKPSYEEMFAPSDQNDTILIVDGKKLHVNKFLSYHSEYFRALFSSNFKEGQMDEIPIGDVSFEDFALLLSTFHPNPDFVTDATVEKLLEMARRFLIPFTIKVTEHYLINWSNIDNEKMLWLADEYGMSTLLEKCIRKITTVENAKKLKKSENYDQLSDKTKAKVFDRLLDSI